MAATTTTPLLTALLKNTTIDDHEELLKASSAALKKSKTDVDAQQVKTVALLKLERYDDAAKFVDASGDQLRNKAPLECAYALYKAGRLEEAADLAATSQSRGAKHLEAQVRYRLEEGVRSAQLYAAIGKTRIPDEDFDLKINQGAVDAQGQWLGTVDTTSVRRPGREELEAFETAYNAACGSIARGELQQAEVLLKRAKELCKHSDTLTEQEKADELLPISTQQLYVLLSLGKTPEADAIASEITAHDIPDLSTKAIAQSNKLLSSSQPANPFLAHKTFNSVPAPPPNDRFFSYQLAPFISNRKTIDLQAMKLDGLANALSKDTSKTSPTSPEALLSSVFGAAALARNEVSKAAIKKVLPELEKRPNDVGLIMTLVQMYALTGNTASATDLVDKLFKRLDSASTENEQDVRFNPSLISVAISLYKSQGRSSQIKQELAKAASYWRHKSKAPASLLRAAGSSLLESGGEEDIHAAAEIFTKLREQQPGNKAALAGYIASCAMEDDGEGSAEIDKLTPIEELTRNIDVDALESEGIPRSSNAIAIAQLSGSRKRKAADSSETKPKRSRKSRLPKDYDASKTPDPERWLPMKDRSYYKPPKGKKKKGKKDSGTQGGAVNEDLDINAKPAAADGAAGGGGGKKKKGKGKK